MSNHKKYVFISPPSLTGYSWSRDHLVGDIRYRSDDFTDAILIWHRTGLYVSHLYALYVMYKTYLQCIQYCTKIS